MDDMFGMLYNDLEPAKKLLTAVSNNMVDSLDKLISDGVNLNSKVMLQNGNCALHVASQNGHSACVQKLLDHGAAADQENSFGFTPLALGLRQGHAQCVKIILQNGSTLTDPNIIWQSQTMSGSPSWIAFTPECLKMLINATPNLSWFDESFIDYLNSRAVELIKYYLMAGNPVSTSKIGEMTAVADADHVAWLKAFQHRCHSLQHYARIAIRRTLQPNVLFASKQLPIPAKIQEYLLITADTIQSSV